jgi:hypothetical protein
MCVLIHWQLNAFNKEVMKKPTSPYAMWAQLEGFAEFVNINSTLRWFRKCFRSLIHELLLICYAEADGSDGIRETLSITGTAVHTALGMLKRHKLLKKEPGPDGIPNIAVILGMLICFAWNFDDIAGSNDETSWVGSIIRTARGHGVEVGGPYKFKERVENVDLDDDDEDDDEDDEFKLGTLGGWHAEVQPQSIPFQM